MIKRTVAPMLTLGVGIALVGVTGCSDTKVPEPVSVSMSSQPLQTTRPPKDEYLRQRALQRIPRPAPPPKTADAAQKLAEFERKATEKRAEWAKLPAAQREQKRAELKHALLIGPTPPAGGQ